MKTLQVFTIAITRNGITMFALQRADTLREAGITMDFACFNAVEPALLAEIEGHGICVHRLKSRRLTLSYVKELAALVRENGYELVHAHGNSSSLFFDMLGAALGGCRVRVAHSHNTTCRFLRKDKLLRPLFYRSYTDAAACGTDAGRWMFGHRPFVVLPNGIPVAQFQYSPAMRKEMRATLGIAQDVPVIGHVGRFNDQKNHAFLIEIFRALLKRRPDACLLSVGDGFWEKHIHEEAAKLNGRVIFTGSVQNPWDYLAAMDRMVLPSLYEGFPTVLLEWQCAGLPILASDAITREVALTPLVQYKALADGAESWADALLALPEGNRAEEGDKAAEVLRAGGYDLSGAGQVMLDFYQSIARKKKKR